MKHKFFATKKEHLKKISEGVNHTMNKKSILSISRLIENKMIMFENYILKQKLKKRFKNPKQKRTMKILPELKEYMNLQQVLLTVFIVEIN